MMMEFTALRVPALTEEVGGKLKILFGGLPGVERFTFAIETQELHIVFDEGQVDFRTLAQELAKAGCPLRNIEAAVLRQVSLQEERKMYGKILVPLDGSALAELALFHAEALAQRFESEILLVKVCPPVSAPIEFYTFGEEIMAEDDNRDLADASLAGSTPQRQAEKIAEDYLTSLQEKLHVKNIKSCCFVLSGSIPEAILDIAETEKVDLIVMSTHGRSGLSRWVYGSVAAKILQAASCPIFLIRAKLEK
jgi:nucleotide-binding universal stress UspA family protein